MTAGVLSGIVTAVLLVCFLAVLIWSWSGSRRASFERAARLPLEQDEIATSQEQGS